MIPWICETKRHQKRKDAWRNRIHGRVDTTLQWIKNAIYYANANNCRAADWLSAHSSQLEHKNSNHSRAGVPFFPSSFIVGCLRSVVFACNVNNVIYGSRANFAIRRLVARSRAMHRWCEQEKNESFKIFTFHSFQLLAEGTCHRFAFSASFFRVGSFWWWPRLEHWTMAVCASKTSRTYIETEPSVDEERNNNKKTYKKRLFRSLH